MADQDRVRENTADDVNRHLDRELEERLVRFEGAGASAIDARIDELEKEWDVERALETNASVIAFIGLVLAVLHSIYWLILPAVVMMFLFQHAVQGWCPPLPVLRRFGFRTRKEIDEEKYALKAIRGDFSGLGPAASAEMALRAVEA